MQFVDQVVLEQRMHELTAAVGQRWYLPGCAFNSRTDSITFSRMIVVLRQIPFSSVCETTYFFGVFMQIAERIAGRHRLERLGVSDVRASAEEQRVDVLHQREEACADVVVPVGHRPAAVLEATIAILVLAARRLNHAVQGDELRHNQFSHGQGSHVISGPVLSVLAANCRILRRLRRGRLTVSARMPACRSTI